MIKMLNLLPEHEILQKRRPPDSSFQTCLILDGPANVASQVGVCVIDGKLIKKSVGRRRSIPLGVAGAVISIVGWLSLEVRVTLHIRTGSDSSLHKANKQECKRDHLQKGAEPW